MLDASTYSRAERAVVDTVSSLPGVPALRRFLTLERVLAGMCGLIPLILYLFDDFSIRGSISAYHDMSPPQAFYFPLSVAAMLFLVNGVIKTGRLYNTVLGAALSGVILFDHDGTSGFFHGVFAVAFFAGNVIVIVWYSWRAAIWIRVVTSLLALAIVLAMLAHFVLDWISLFWAESLSLVAITAHYFLDSFKLGGYDVPTRR